MSHPAIDPVAVSRLRDRLGRSPESTDQGALLPPPAAGPRSTAVKVRAAARRVAAPVVDRVRHELDRAVEGELAALRSEVAELRDEVARNRAEHSAAIAALQEDHRTD